MVRKKGNEYCVYDHTGKKELGCHPTYGEAVIQLRAIEASKAKSKKHKGGKK